MRSTGLDLTGGCCVTKSHSGRACHHWQIQSTMNEQDVSACSLWSQFRVLPPMLTSSSWVALGSAPTSGRLWVRFPWQAGAGNHLKSSVSSYLWLSWRAWRGMWWMEMKWRVYHPESWEGAKARRLCAAWGSPRPELANADPGDAVCLKQHARCVFRTLAVSPMSFFGW